MKSSANLILPIFLVCTCNAQNLLMNGDFSGGNVGFTNDYTYVPSGVSQTPGTYSVRTNSQNFNPGYTLFYDHTTGSGNMLLIDGLPGSTKYAWTETVSVMTNTQYTFSCWATSSDPYNVPTLQFSINGNQIGSEITLSTSSGQWQQFIAIWNSGANNSAAISVVDDNPNGYTYGNDFALDDFSFSQMTPSLSVTLSGINKIIISWPSPSVGFVLQQNTNLTTTNWTDSILLVNDNGTTKSVTNSATAGNLFFRLWHP